ncbi:Rh-like protein/ammonium transporter [Echria macrotheca]|uniref:Rh-like protein/ammonium transporter n=1 Tax=Echria macrotheca TaxID=438768 RepID=A0AAJ0BJ43_9PEZI|nr:Rh-like protein/ammonium transporter [Echria macrotheca]
MASYPLDVAPPLLRKIQGGLVSDDALLQSPQDFFQGADIVWVMVAGGLVLQMIPAIAMFYSGATDRSSTLTLLRMPIITAAFCSVQWYLWGYALTFASGPGETTSTWYGGHIRAMALYRAWIRPVGAAGPKIPELLYAFYQGMFAAFTPALVCGGVIKRFKMGRFLIFIWLWSLLVYYPVARWAWSPDGFSSQHGVMDFAGGTVVHITSGTAAGAVVLFHAMEKYGWGIFKQAWRTITTSADEGKEVDAMKLRTRLAAGNQQNGGTVSDEELGEQNHFVLTRDAPHSINNLVIGTMLLWIGWLGFNGGSALGGNLRAVSACASTHVAASTGGCVMLVLFWTAEEAARRWPTLFGGGSSDGSGDGSGGGKLSVVHFCDGAVVGLVAVTPAAGYVPVWSAGCIGAISAIIIFGLKGTFLQHLMRGDPLFVFLIHAGGGFVGMVLTGCFAKDYVVGFDGFSVLLDRSVAERVGWQVADACMGFGYSLAMTTGILLFMKILLRPFSGTWRLLGDNEVDKLEAELEYKWRKRSE